MLDKARKQHLKAQAHALKPVVLFGAKGLTDALLNEIDHALLANDLIKIKLTGIAREDRMSVITTVCDTLKADFVQLMGTIATVYRFNPNN